MAGLEAPSRIGPGLRLQGNITGEEALIIDGEVMGMISLSGARLTITRDAHVTANLQADEVVLSGHVEGDVVASKRIEVRSTARLTGDLRSPRLSIEDGALIAGRVGELQDEADPEPNAVAPESIS